MRAARSPTPTRARWSSGGPATEVTRTAVARYRSHYLDRAAQPPGFAVWADLGEHAATGAAVTEVVRTPRRRVAEAGGSARLAEAGGRAGPQATPWTWRPCGTPARRARPRGRCRETAPAGGLLLGECLRSARGRADTGPVRRGHEFPHATFGECLVAAHRAPALLWPRGPIAVAAAHTRRMRFQTTVALAGKTATGMAVPAEVMASLGPKRRVAVTVTVGGHAYRTTVGPYKGAYMVPLSAQNRTAAGVEAGDEVEVDIALDTAPREVVVPEDLRAALDAAPSAGAAFEALSYSDQRAHVLAVEGAKAQATRDRRVEKVIATMLG